jgi:hypothetical protein
VRIHYGIPQEDDVNDEAGSEGPIGPRAKLFFHNDPSTWLRLSSAESADAYGKGYEQDARECERSDKVIIARALYAMHFA